MFNSRQAAYLALLEWQQHGTFLWDSLQKWKEKTNPPARDLNFAYELACGTARYMRLCDYIASTQCKKLPSKPKERFLLRLVIYQKLFLKNIPPHAVANTSVDLAKTYCHASFASFLNAFLRNWQDGNQEFLIEKLPPSIRLSYPDFFVDELSMQYGQSKAVEILERGNSPPVHAAKENPFGYIQNKTQFELISQLANSFSNPPSSILDMCAAPGGKTICLHNLFENASITANDSSASRLKTLRENLSKFSCPATILHKQAQDLAFASPFDLILVDAPCSNSGVLYKCPEARWRISKEEIEKHISLQLELLKKAYTLSAPGKTIWYMTCSILKQENELVIQQFSKDFQVKVDRTIVQLPDNEGHEGGFGCQISILN